LTKLYNSGSVIGSDRSALIILNEINSEIDFSIQATPWVLHLYFEIHYAQNDASIFQNLIMLDFFINVDAMIVIYAYNDDKYEKVNYLEEYHHYLYILKFYVNVFIFFYP